MAFFFFLFCAKVAPEEFWGKFAYFCCCLTARGLGYPYVMRTKIVQTQFALLFLWISPQLMEKSRALQNGVR